MEQGLTGYLVVDTNTLLHFKPIQDLPWQDLAGFGRVVLILPFVVLGELDRLREEHRFQKMKDRARSILADLHRRLSADPSVPVHVREGVSLVLAPREPTSWAEHTDLDRMLADDRVLLTALEWRRDHRDGEVALVTHDVGPSLKALLHGLRVVRLPDELRAAQVIDESERELRALRGELERLRNARPNVCLRFQNESTVFDLVPHQIEQLDEATMKRMYRAECNQITMEEPRSAKPLADVDAPPGTSQIALLAAEFARVSMFEPTREQREQYQRECAGYLERFAEYLGLLRDYRAQCSQIHELVVFIVNDGRVAADDVDVFIVPPSSCRFVDRCDLPREPVPPFRPERPSLFWNQLSMGRIAQIVGSPPYDGGFFEGEARGLLAVDSDWVDDEGVGRVNLRRLKQGLRHDVTLYLRLPTSEVMSAVELSCQIIVGNGIDKHEQTLLVRLAKLA